jgi:uncharacterized protein
VGCPFPCPTQGGYTRGDHPETLGIDITYRRRLGARRIHATQIISKLLSGNGPSGHRTVVPQVAGCATLGRVGDQEEIELANRAFVAARGGDAAALTELVGAGVPVNLCNEAGDTLVMLAAYHGHAPAVSVLVKAGADANRANDRGQTPIAGAVFKGEDEVVQALLDGGADPFAGTPSAVDTARMFGRNELLALFERKG